MPTVMSGSYAGLTTPVIMLLKIVVVPLAAEAATIPPAPIPPAFVCATPLMVLWLTVALVHSSSVHVTEPIVDNPSEMPNTGSADAVLMLPIRLWWIETPSSNRT